MNLNYHVKNCFNYKNVNTVFVSLYNEMNILKKVWPNVHCSAAVTL